MTKRLGRPMGVPLVGCASHRLNLVVRGFLDPYEEDLEQVKSLMKRMRTITHAAKLRYATFDFNNESISQVLVFKLLW
jgi:hypothetical protein